MDAFSAPRYSLREEIAASLIHGVGLVLAIAGFAVLAVVAARHGDAWHVVACSVFGATLVLLYTASTLYHSIPPIRLPRAKSVLQVLDHSAIFLLIAGTYTPFTLVSLRGPWGWTLFGVIWTLALLGILARALMPRRPTALFVALYVVMGWTILVALDPMSQRLAPGGLRLLFAGGVAYTAGVAFYLWRRLPYHHAVWHGFVLLGSILHFFAVLLYVIPLEAAPAAGA
jgi:hemolysin III